MATTKSAEGEAVDMKLEVMVIGVSDVDRAKAFYEKLGCRLLLNGPPPYWKTSLTLTPREIKPSRVMLMSSITSVRLCTESGFWRRHSFAEDDRGGGIAAAKKS